MAQMSSPHSPTIQPLHTLTNNHQQANMKVSTIIASAAVTKRATEHGELTCHAGGIGACGWAIAPGEVAISYNDLFALQTPNDNPLCGKTIQATAGGVTKTVATAAVPASAAISPSLRSTSTPSASPPPWVACQSTGRTLSESKVKHPRLLLIISVHLPTS
ncbi:hypothetical protein CLAFUW4_04057 [Fulvia fulva]|uniref:Uncharacterized protein n=1 Tax=Passalora fulva TaxID=5499 RepID=A0A9Q8LEE6_PASFU|nr:uncharacterized protein CLAFUR5_04021 [Fulvia fulva]KAK4626817.1 hypothetical protein CLAFUR4_04043 [Fulvia fulva]KAK4628071.1 hypothetical protein CLAFUR0_04044 [Fulvia fulva]UJO15880.1 hypothetical protein CLAFUR5_04021 [Fulvia fulva]WPV14359.1 hypothetical protein CLAFUW4_04057 [Fulvia fulva]WPV28787.1 hypothetical protein CLAFUW7_04046 [Fulvia fulva]